MWFCKKTGFTYFLDTFLLGSLQHFGYYDSLSTRHTAPEQNRVLRQTSISWTGETVENVMPPLWVSKTQVNKQLLLVTTNSQARNPQTIPNISNMIVVTHVVTEEY